MGYVDDLVTQKLMNKYGVSWFKFDEASGNVTGSKGTAVGTLHNNPIRVTGWNGEGYAMSFNGVNQYVQFNDKVIPTGEKSIRFKIKTTQTTLGMLFTQSAGSAHSGAQIYIYGGKIGLIIGKSVSGNPVLDMISNKTINDGEWHDILFTWDGTANVNGVKIFIDNNNTPDSQSKSFGLETLIPTYNLRFGASNTTPINYYFNGQIDNLEIYNKSLKPSDFNLYQSFLLDNGVYKSYKNSSWQTISATTPTIEQFINDGMDSLSPLLDRTSGTSPIDQLSRNYKIITWTNTSNAKLLLESPTPSQIVYPIGDISLFGVETVDSLILTATGNVKTTISFDNGLIWKAYKNGVWEVVDNAHSGMTTSELNALASQQIMEAKGDSQFIRFSYSLVGDAEVDSIQMKISLFGSEKIADSSDFDLNYDNANKTVVYSIKKSGTYSVNYVT